MNFKTGFKTALWFVILFFVWIVLFIQLLYILFQNVKLSKICKSSKNCTDFGNKVSNGIESISDGKPPHIKLVIGIAKYILQADAKKERFHSLKWIKICIFFIVFSLVAAIVWYGYNNVTPQYKDYIIGGCVLLIILVFFGYFTLHWFYYKNKLVIDKASENILFVFKKFPNIMLNVHFLVCLGVAAGVYFLQHISFFDGLPNDVTDKMFWSVSGFMAFISFIVTMSANIDYFLDKYVQNKIGESKGGSNIDITGGGARRKKSKRSGSSFKAKGAQRLKQRRRASSR